MSGNDAMPTGGALAGKKIACSTRVRSLIRMFALTATVMPLNATAGGDPVKGAITVKLCLSCHALEPDRQMTGPSLAGIVGRKAGSVSLFDRYSPALKNSGLTWDIKTLEAWIANPQSVIPGNTMSFIVDDAERRADIVAYLAATQDPASTPRTDLPKPFQQTTDLKSAGRASMIASITYCRDTYTLTMENGAKQLFWERNLRFKTDSSSEGPPEGKAALVPSGQMGDRAYVVVGTPPEMSAFVKQVCDTR